MKMVLVDVQSDTYNRLTQVFPFEFVLDQNTTDFSVFPINVVWPFDGKSFRVVGQGINDAKYDMDTPTVFAWTLLIIIFSLLLEWTVNLLTRRWKRNA